MGDVIDIGSFRARRQRRGPSGPPSRASFYFDLSCPFSYMAAERVDASFGEVCWIPAHASALRQPALASVARREQVLSTAARRATALRLPLVWPDRGSAEVPRAMRAAAHAAEAGRGAAFVLAAGRLAFGGGFDLEESATLAEAAAAAAIDVDDCLAAASDTRRDAALEAAGRRLRADGAHQLPALRVGAHLFCGERRVAEAAAAARRGLAARGSA